MTIRLASIFWVMPDTENYERKQDVEKDNRVSAKHSALAHSRISNGGGGRNSSIETLRIIAMFMILAHHFIVHNGYDVLKLPGTGADRLPARHGRRRQGRRGHLLLHLRMVLPRQEQTIKSNLKRVWIMERELLFWSLAFVAFYLMFDGPTSA